MLRERRNQDNILPSTWQRTETSKGVPYYVNHNTETTQWEHPEMTQLMTDLNIADDIKYAAYRTAVKLRAISKHIQLDLIDLSTIRAGFYNLGYQESFTENDINVSSLEKILLEIFTYQNNKNQNINVAEGVELTINWLLNVYDPSRTGYIRVISVKIGLACLCVARVQEKYKYIFDQISSSKGYIDKARLRVFLKDALQILRNIKEYNSFGRNGIEPTVQSCFETAFIPERISLQEFLDWVINEPRALVWLPTLHRLAMSETVKHEGKCNICKMFPIIGFRYRCLKCFNFDMCQNCFWSGRVSKNHKLSHQTQEYCLPATQKEDMKDFAKVMKSKVRKKKKKRKTNTSNKDGFISPPHDNTYRQMSDDDQTSVDGLSDVASKSTTTINSRLSSDHSVSADDEEDEIDNRKEPNFSKFLRPRPVMDDEHQLISYYISCLNGNSQPPTSTPIQTLAAMEQSHIKELDEIVRNLELDNRCLKEKILEMQDEEARKSFNLGDRDYIIEENERLEAKREVLEDHNRRLADQLSKLHFVMQQENSTPCQENMSMPRLFPGIGNKEKMESLKYSDKNIEETDDVITLNHDEIILEELPTLHPRKDALENSLINPKENTINVFDMNRGYTSDRYHRTTTMSRHSTSSDDDLRAIEERLEQLLETEDVEIEILARDNENRTRKLDSDSEEEKKYLLAAASMVGEAVDGLLSSFSNTQ